MPAWLRYQIYSTSCARAVGGMRMRFCCWDPLLALAFVSVLASFFLAKQPNLWRPWGGREGGRRWCLSWPACLPPHALGSLRPPSDLAPAPYDRLHYWLSPPPPGPNFTSSLSASLSQVKGVTLNGHLQTLCELQRRWVRSLTCLSCIWAFQDLSDEPLFIEFRLNNYETFQKLLHDAFEKAPEVAWPSFLDSFDTTWCARRLICMISELDITWVDHNHVMGTFY